MDFRKILFGVAAGAALALTGCSGVCSDNGSCSGDDDLEESDITECEEALDSDCGSEYEELRNCFLDNQVCGDDDKTDGLKTAEKCESEGKAFFECCGKNKSAKGCSEG